MKFHEKFPLLLISACLTILPVTYRGFLWTALTQGRVLLELSSVVIFLPDFFLMALFVVSLLRFLLDESYQNDLTDTITYLFKRLGGVFWMVLILWVMLGYGWAREKLLVQYTVFRLVLELSFAVVVADIVRRDAPAKRFFLLALVIGAGFQASVAIGQVLSGGELGLGWLGERSADEFYGASGMLRGYGLTVNPNNLSGYLLVGVFACIALFMPANKFTSDEIKSRLKPTWSQLQWPSYRIEQELIPMILVGFTVLIGLFATGSRTAIVSLLTTGLIMYGLYKRKLWGNLVVCFGMTLCIFSPFFIRTNSVSAENRLFFAYDDTLEILKTAPLLGVGGNNLMVEISHLHPFEAELLLPAHNAFLMIWAEHGVVGLILVLLSFYPIIRHFHPQQEREVFLWGGCLLAIALVMLFDFYFWGDFRSRTLWFFVLGMWWGANLGKTTELA